MCRSSAPSFVVPVIYINNLPEYLKEGSPFLRYLRETKVPFAILINYGSAAMSAADGQAAWKLLTGEFKDQFLGWMSGESVGYVWEQSPAELKINSSMSRRELLEAHRVFYTNAIARKWAAIFPYRYRRDVGQADSRPVNFEHFIRTRVDEVGRTLAWHRDCRRAADVRYAHRLHARRGATIRRKFSLLSRAKLWRYRNDVHQSAKLCRAG